MDVSPRPAATFSAPTFEAFAQAPTSSGPFYINPRIAEFEEITKEAFERNISTTAHVLHCQVNARNVPKDARKLIGKAAQICESRIHGAPAPTQPCRSSCPGGSSLDYSRSQSSTKKRACLSLKRNAEDIGEQEEKEDNLSDEQPLETGDNHGTTSAEHDDTLVTEDHHDKLETAPPSTHHIQPTSHKSSQSVLFELEDELPQERKKEALLKNQPICASFITSASAINPALITQPNPVPNTGNISNPPLSPAHDNSTGQSLVQPNTQSDSQPSPTCSAFCSATPPPNNHPVSSTQTALPQSSAAPVSPNPPASPSQPLIDDTTATTNIPASTFPLLSTSSEPAITSNW
ncbi:hypothetical protein DFH28DRAFT_935867 [Melampsora americana]|nr:hypothetical protein DFH28DRAFT_935867 [Melampsora americana]